MRTARFVHRETAEPPITGTSSQRLRELFLRAERKTKEELEKDAVSQPLRLEVKLKRETPVLQFLTPQKESQGHDLLELFLEEKEPLKYWLLVPIRMGSLFDFLQVLAQHRKEPVVCLVKKALLSYLKKEVEARKKSLPDWLKKRLLALIELEKLYNQVQGKLMITEYFPDWEFITTAETAEQAHKLVKKLLLEEPQIRKALRTRKPPAPIAPPLEEVEEATVSLSHSSSEN